MASAVVIPPSLIMAARKGWSLLLSHSVGQLTVIRNSSTPTSASSSSTPSPSSPSSGVEKEKEQQPQQPQQQQQPGDEDSDSPVAQSTLVAHACQLRKITGNYVTIEGLLVAIPSSPALELLGGGGGGGGEVTSETGRRGIPVNYAAGHTNPTMATRFRQIGLTFPRLSVSGELLQVDDSEIPPLFQAYFSHHPLLRRHSRTSGSGASQWKLFRMSLHEAFYVSPAGALEPLQPTAAAAAAAAAATVEEMVQGGQKGGASAAECEYVRAQVALPLDIAEVANVVMAKVNARPPTALAQLCNHHLLTSSGTTATSTSSSVGVAAPAPALLKAAFMYHLLDDAFDVMGLTTTTTTNKWSSFRVPYLKGNSATTAKTTTVTSGVDLVEYFEREFQTLSTPPPRSSAKTQSVR